MTVSLRAFLYFIALLYLLLGCTVVTEYILASMSIITSTTKTIHLSKPPGQLQDSGLDTIEVRVWHDTLVNLAFIAFSTSATEILLCTIEIVSSNFDHGELGPGFILGSAAFNVLVVTSICMVSLPASESRKIEKLQVYYVSMFFSLAGYCWILVTLFYSSPSMITLWESLVTALMFPVYILVVWLSHNKLWGCKRSKPTRHISVDEKKDIGEELFLDGQLDRENLARLVHRLKRHPGLTEHDVATLAAFKLLRNQPHSDLWYRIGGVRAMTAGYRNTPRMEARLRNAYIEITDKGGAWTNRSTTVSTNVSKQRSSSRSAGTSVASLGVSLHHEDAAIVEFRSAIVSVPRTEGKLEIAISRYGNLAVQAKVRLTTVDGTAKKHRDYLPIDQVLLFESGQREVYVEVTIVHNTRWEEDEEFFLKLSLIHNEHERVELGRLFMMAVTVIDGENQSVVTFEKRGQLVSEGDDTVTVLVNRHEGAAGQVSVLWRTVDKTARSGYDYIGGSGELVFNSGEMSLYIELPICNHMTENRDVYFEIELYSPSGDAKLGRINRCTVTITGDADLKSFIGTMASITTMNLDAIRVQKSTWGEQIRNALLVDGGKVDEPSRLDYVAHFFAFLWKVLFSLIPPPTLLGGWPCFLVSLCALGMVIIFIQDTASIFGCLIHMDENVVGISFIALGTCLPDVISARKEVLMEKTADACMISIASRIAANLTLGLGVPWVIAVVYHEVQGTVFKIVDPGILANVLIFTVLLVVSQVVFIIRRVSPWLGNAEIGGPPVWKWTTCAIFVLMWLSYMTLNHYSWHGHITPFE